MKMSICVDEIQIYEKPLLSPQPDLVLQKDDIDGCPDILS